MSFIQNATTKKFVNAVKTLIDTGKVRTLKDLSVKLEYNYSALAQIVAGSRNVPDHVNTKFTDLYKPVEVQQENVYIIALQNQAMNRVILRAMAELLSKQRDESVAKTLGDLEAAVRVEIQRVSER